MNKFTVSEIQLARYLFAIIEKGGHDLSQVPRHPAWAGLVRKFQQMELETRETEEPSIPVVVSEEEQTQQRFRDQGYTDKEIATMMQILKRPRR